MPNFDVDRQSQPAPESFKVWLRQFRGQETELGDLDQDVLNIITTATQQGQEGFPVSENDITPAVAFLKSHGLDQNSLRVLVEAWKTYCAQKSIEDQTDYGNLESEFQIAI